MLLSLIAHAAGVSQSGRTQLYLIVKLSPLPQGRVLGRVTSKAQCSGCAPQSKCPRQIMKEYPEYSSSVSKDIPQFCRLKLDYSKIDS